MLTVLSVVGTRPEAIKMAPVIRQLGKYPGRVHSLVCVTGQHRGMVDQMMELFDIKADVDLDLMEFNQSPARTLGKAVGAIDRVLRDLTPDIMLVQGDTTTAMAASMVAFLNRVPLGHVEAGLRSFDKLNPFPEEINRRVTSLVADWHFAPTELARRNLLKEGVNERAIYVTGNTVIDALLAVLDKGVDFPPPELAKVDFDNRKVILVTAHRRENHGECLQGICKALWDIVERNPEVEVVYPVHLNPNVELVVRASLNGHPRIHLVPPLGYQAMVNLMRRTYLIVTDSGGIQEEAPSLGKPVLVLRDITERPEAVAAGVARIVGTKPEAIVRETERLLFDTSEYSAMANGVNPYGDGKAASRIVSILMEHTSG